MIHRRTTSADQTTVPSGDLVRPASASSPSARPALLSRALGGEPYTMSSSSSSSSASASSTGTDLFPSSSSTSAAAGQGGGGTNVYYLVFLGVLIVVVLLATCLAYRAFRLRRRYRTAAQIAIMRGQVPPGGFRDLGVGEEWGLGGMAGWTEEGLDRWAANPEMSQREVWEMAMGLRGEGPGPRGKKGPKVGKRPEFWEAEAEEEARMGTGAGTGTGPAGTAARESEKHGWDQLQPLTVHSLAAAPTLDPALIPSLLSAPRHRSPFASWSALARPRRRRESASPAPAPAPDPQTRITDALAAWQNRLRENERALLGADPRGLQDGEPVRVAVVIQMPKSAEQLGRERESDAELKEEGEEPVGWRGGMELGVWEGVVEFGQGTGTVTGTGTERQDGRHRGGHDM